MENDFNNAFSVVPMNQTISLVPGEIYEGKITVVNPADSTDDLSYHAKVTPFTISDENYTMDLLSESDRTAIVKWIEIPEPSGTLKPNETKTIKFIINTPSNLPAGGQYAAITISSDNQANKNDPVSVQNVFEIASILYIDIAGETVHEGEIISNNIPSFVFSSPVTISSVLLNKGNVHEKATYSISAIDALSGQTIFPVIESDGYFGEMIMPDSKRCLEKEINNLPAIGAVKITQSISYLGQTSYEERTVIICPIWLIILTLTIISTIIAVIVVLIRRRRRSKTKAII